MWQRLAFTCDNVDEVRDFPGYGSVTHFQARRQVSNATHYCTISCVYDNATAGT